MLKETFLGRVALNAQMDVQAETVRQRRAEFLGRMGLGLMELGLPRTGSIPASSAARRRCVSPLAGGVNNSNSFRERHLAAPTVKK